ncbi:calcium binding EGF domain protein [Necator americanus]|uniref:Calcium binding EGF domain protein n=1 Tax=Necator americanus TaxID=51031 RepID=W2SJW9_NECAM|nr:calcium binding EGF domain protein [Necator americanus]ETN69833.1 calcium binding EGF domain protein [Necator americanus]
MDICGGSTRAALFNVRVTTFLGDLCLLEPDPGYCNDERKGQWWFYFNSDAGVCEKFFFYGCGGNDNKFYSLHMCNKVCGERLSPQIDIDECRGYKAVCDRNAWCSNTIGSYNCECMASYRGDGKHCTCQAFWYDGCKGRSRNIFSDYETCAQMCEETSILTRAVTSVVHYRIPRIY